MEEETKILLKIMICELGFMAGLLFAISLRY